MNDDLVRKYSTINGHKKWSSSITIPLEVARDDEYVSHLKRELKERCIKEYINNVPDSFEYRISTNRVEPIAVLTLELEDLFELKNGNKNLRNQLIEMIDRYKILENTIKQGKLI